jgi:hypothetical protein
MLARLALETNHKTCDCRCMPHNRSRTAQRISSKYRITSASMNSGKNQLVCSRQHICIIDHSIVNHRFMARYKKCSPPSL